MIYLIFLDILQSENSTMKNAVELPSVAGLFFRVILTLLFILFVIYMIIRLINMKQNLKQNQKKWVKIIDYQGLGTNRGLYLMELYDVTCIVSVCEGQISILKEIDKNDDRWQEIEEGINKSDDVFPKGVINLLRGGYTGKSNDDISKDISRDAFKNKLYEQLKRTKDLSQNYLKRRDRGE
ncbi:MAG: flagellar biosynthetic protein FliO [Clostridia bacterium]|nr:flagellar biosynthetic protein FliO [Clostridia bacterium]MDD4047615.1 flagellar biosynthetic protein FliO [Clostridia bacterium]